MPATTRAVVEAACSTPVITLNEYSARSEMERWE